MPDKTILTAKQILEKITTTFLNSLLDACDWSASCPGNLKFLYSLDRRWVDSIGGEGMVAKKKGLSLDGVKNSEHLVHSQ